jgi:hypothetical protein
MMKFNLNVKNVWVDHLHFHACNNFQNIVSITVPMETEGFSPGIKGPNYHSPPLNAKSKNTRSFASKSPIKLLDVVIISEIISPDIFMHNT